MSAYRNEMEKYVFFSLNYPYDFIERVWSDDRMMAEHLTCKFEEYYEQVGSYGAMNKFYANLSSDNRNKLDEFIRNW